MPRPRFRRLPRTKQERILEAAARAFAADGYEGASLNQILETAEISKGAAYYYFDDKADLFATAVRYCASELVGDLPLPLPDVTEEEFWPTLSRYYQRQFAQLADRPWIFGAVKAAARLSPQMLARNEDLNEYVKELRDGLEALIVQGQSLGVIRRDLPLPLLLRIFIAVDDALDQWLLENGDSMSGNEMAALAGRVLDGLALFLSGGSDD